MSDNTPEIKCSICGKPHLTYKCWNHPDRKAQLLLVTEGGWWIRLARRLVIPSFRELMCLWGVEVIIEVEAFVGEITAVMIEAFAVKKKGKRKVQGVPQSQTAAFPRPQEEEETDKSKQAQIEQTYEKH